MRLSSNPASALRVWAAVRPPCCEGAQRPKGGSRQEGKEGERGRREGQAGEGRGLQEHPHTRPVDETLLDLPAKNTAKWMTLTDGAWSSRGSHLDPTQMPDSLDYDNNMVATSRH